MDASTGAAPGTAIIRVIDLLPRSPVRNIVNKGIPERVAMAVAGSQDESVFDRYHFVNAADLQEVARKVTGTNFGHSRT